MRMRTIYNELKLRTAGQPQSHQREYGFVCNADWIGILSFYLERRVFVFLSNLNEIGGDSNVHARGIVENDADSLFVGMLVQKPLDIEAIDWMCF